VTIISSLAAEEDLISQSPDLKTFSASAPPQEEYHHRAPQIHIEPEPAAMESAPLDESIPFEDPVAAEATPAPAFAPSEPAPLISTPQKKTVPHKEGKVPSEKSAQAKQEVLQFEPVTRGRFEKSEPTIVEGEDLDVPTYLRKNIKVK
jgi:cell division protein FtsZ